MWNNIRVRTLTICGVQTATWKLVMGTVSGCGPFPRGLALLYTLSSVAPVYWKNKTDLHSLLDCTLPSSKKISQQWQSIIWGMPMQQYTPFISLTLHYLASQSSIHGPVSLPNVGQERTSPPRLHGENNGAGERFRINKVLWGHALVRGVQMSLTCVFRGAAFIGESSKEISLLSRNPTELWRF